MRQAIIVAGGNGVRMNNSTPKQFLEFCRKPILMHTIERFAAFDKNIRIIVVLPPALFEEWKTLCLQHHFTIQHTLAPGGFSRFHSVKNALDECKKEGVIAVHDGVRPLVSPNLIQDCFESAEKGASTVPVIEPVDSLREIKGEKSIAVSRNNYRQVQTPQVFDAKILHQAYTTPYLTNFTDDASVVEYAGYPISLIEGSRFNIKITTPVDMQIAEALLPILFSSPDVCYPSPKPDVR